MSYFVKTIKRTSVMEQDFQGKSPIVVLQYPTEFYLPFGAKLSDVFISPKKVIEELDNF